MREILFRGKTREGKWNESSAVFIRGELALMLTERPIKELVKDKNGELVDVIFNFCAVEKETVGQFTGLTDKNGKKIFEGDIVKCRHTIRLLEPKEKVLIRKNPRRSYGIEAVKREDPIYRLYRDEDLYDLVYFRNYVVKADTVGQRTRLQNGSDTHYLSTSYVSNHEIEVIGNIHDNPELLEVE